MREEEEKISRDWEPPGASLWRLEELQEPRHGLRDEGVEEHRGGSGPVYISFWSCLWHPPSFLCSLPPPVLHNQPKLIPGQAECLLRGAGGRERQRGRVKELSTSFSSEVQGKKWGELVKLWGRETLWEEEGVGGASGCSWLILNTASPPWLLLSDHGWLDNGPPPSSPSLLFNRGAGQALGLVSSPFDWT